MKLTIKTLKGEIINIDAQPAQTVQDVKNKIKQAKGFEIEAQKLVFKGKNTSNTDTLDSLGVKEADFMVVMVTNKKPEQKPLEKQPEQKPVEKVEQKQQSHQQPPTEKQEGGAGLATGQQYEAALEGIIAMGFERQTAVAAMKAAYNNPDRAVEYCINGIPKKAPSQGQVAGSTAPLGAGQTGGLDPSVLMGLVNSPQFAQIRQMIRSNPDALPQLLNQISESSPQVFQLISQNPQLFQRLLLGNDVPQGPPPGAIQVTSEQKEAIERLASLGFPKIEAAQAYLACDKNQQMAANLLFDRQANGDFDPDPEEQAQGQSGQGGQGGKKNNEDDDNDNLFS